MTLYLNNMGLYLGKCNLFEIAFLEFFLQIFDMYALQFAKLGMSGDFPFHLYFSRSSLQFESFKIFLGIALQSSLSNTNTKGQLISECTFGTYLKFSKEQTRE